MTPKKVLSLFGGGVVGAAIGWVIAEVLVYQLIEKKEEELMNNFVEVENIIENEGYDQPQNIPILFNQEKSERIRVTEGQIKRNDDIKVIKNYAEIAKQKINLGENVVEVEDVEEETEDESRITCRVVTEQEWLETDWDSKTLNYYAEDRVLTYSDDEKIPYPEIVIGFEALDSFGEGTGDPDTVFVCNEDDGLFYEIVRIHGSYSEIVLGAPKKETPKKKKSVSKNEVALEKIDEEEHAKRKGRAKEKSKFVDEAEEE